MKKISTAQGEYLMTQRLNALLNKNLSIYCLIFLCFFIIMNVEVSFMVLNRNIIATFIFYF